MRIVIYVFLFLICYNAHADKLHKFCKSANTEKLNFVMELPVEIINNNYILDGVKIKGSNKTYCFLLDTGASTSCISKNITETIGVNVVLRDSISDGVRKEVADYSFCDLSFCNLNFTKVGVTILSDESMNIFDCCQRIDGIIGYNVMRNFVWQFIDGKVFISNKVDKLNNIGSLQKDKISKGSAPLIVAGFKDGYRATMLFDLGDNGTLEVSDNMQKYLRKKRIVKGHGSLATTLIGEVLSEESMRLVHIPGFFIGEDTLKNPIAYVGESILTCIGAGVLNYYNMTFDFPKYRLYIDLKKDNFDDSEFENFGFKYWVVNGEVFLRFVWENTEAYEKGMKYGQKIIQIEDLDLTKLVATESCKIYEEIDKILKYDTEKEFVTVKVLGINEELTLPKKKLFQGDVF